MAFIEAPTNFYLGRTFNQQEGKLGEDVVYYDSRDLTTHSLIVGMTGSGKTGLGITMLEEAMLDNIPAIVIDPKGDITNLALNFPDLSPQQFKPWISPDEARRAGMDMDTYAHDIAQTWRDGLQQWGIVKDRLRWRDGASQVSIYTPGSDAGLPISILASLRAPRRNWQGQEEEVRERINGLVSALFTLAGMNFEPVKDVEHVLLTNIIEHNWRKGKDLTLEDIVIQIQEPPFDKLGVFPLDKSISEKKRYNLAMELNNIIATPSFQNWLKGEPMDIQRLLYRPNGRPRVSVFYTAHLTEQERMFITTLLLETVIGWMRSLSGTPSLRAILYIDEMFGYFPPYPRNPPTKEPVMRLLKQARAYGLGLVLATQNPGDLDYKGLTNMGTWFIGRLSSDNDRKKVMSGLKSMASADDDLNLSDVEQLIADVQPRVFLMRNVHDSGGPILMHTRWAMSYLAGPMTRRQISRLMHQQKQALMQRLAQEHYQQQYRQQGYQSPQPFQSGGGWTQQHQQQQPPQQQWNQGQPNQQWGNQPPPPPGFNQNQQNQQMQQNNQWGNQPPPPPGFNQNQQNQPPPPPGFNQNQQNQQMQQNNQWGNPNQQQQGQNNWPQGNNTQFWQQGPQNYNAQNFGAQSAPGGNQNFNPNQTGPMNGDTGATNAIRNDRLPGDYKQSKPPVSSAIDEYFLPTTLDKEQAFARFQEQNGQSVSANQPVMIAYKPVLLGQTTVRYQEKKAQIYTGREYAFHVEDLDPRGLLHWEEHQAPVIDPRQLRKEPLDPAAFQELPNALQDSSRIKQLEKELQDFLYNTARLIIPYHPQFKMYGDPDTDMSNFQSDVYQKAREERDAELDKLSEQYGRKMDRLEEKLVNKERELDAEKLEIEDRNRERLYTTGEAILSIFQGRTNYTLSRMSRANRYKRQTEEDIRESHEEISNIEGEILALEEEYEQKLNEVNEKWAQIANSIEEHTITPYKKDINITLFGVGWIPHYYVQQNGQPLVIPAFA